MMIFQKNIVQLNNRTRSVIFIQRLNLSAFEMKQKIAELHKKGEIFTDEFLDQKQIPRVLSELYV